MKKNVVIIILFWISPYLLNAQDLNPYNNIIPPNPDAASLAKYADYPVDLSSGVPQISIPLWNIKCGDINVPISLSYHAGGIPVAETPSFVGLGWTLNAGGAITRTIRGIADDGMFKYPDNGTPSEISGILTYYSSYAIYPNYPNNSEDNANPLKYEEAAVGKRDLEPDMFCYNFCNIAGKFVFDFDGTPHLIPRKNYRIEKVQNTLESSSNRRIINWTITTDNGFKYYFEEYEETEQDTKTEGWLPNGDNLNAVMISNSHTTSEHNSAWFLTKIKMANSSDSVAFEYETINIENIYPVSASFKAYKSCSGGTPLHNGNDIYEETQTTATITSKRLKRIISPDQIIEFIPGNYRHDLKGDRVLDEIIVRNKEDKIIKLFKLTYNYFSNNGMTSVGTNANADTDADTELRLSLKSLKEYDENNNSLPAYTFEYEDQVWLPDRLTSKAQDHWGYHNGEEQNSSLLPYLSSIRDAHGDDMKAGSLIKINYPTGGYTQFNYEANSVENGTSVTWDEINAYCEVGACDYVDSENTFIIDDASGSATIKIMITGNYNGSYECGSCNAVLIDPDDPTTYIYLAIEGPNGTIRMPQEFAINGLTTGTVDLDEERTIPNGTYKIKAQKSDGVNFYDIESCDASPIYRIRFSVEGLQQIASNGQKDVGGLRIKEKIDYDPNSGKSLFKQYEYNLSGYLGYWPNYSYTTSTNNTTYYSHTSSSNSALNNGAGTIIYRDVTVIEGNNEIGINGKTENGHIILQSHNTYPVDKISIDDKVNLSLATRNTGLFPFAPAISGAWGCGLLESQQIYKYDSDNNSFTKIKEIRNIYKNDYWGVPDSYNSETDVLAAKVGVVSTCSDCMGKDEFGTTKSAIQFYFIPSRNINLTKTIETDYDENENPTTSKVTDIEYDNFSPYIYPSKIKNTLSDGSQIVEQTLYPQDYTNEGNDFIGLMKTFNIVNKPIEKVTYIHKNSNTLITNGNIFTYKVGDNVGRLDKIFRLQTATPIDKPEFKLSNKTTSNALSHDEGTNTSFTLNGIDSKYTDTPVFSVDRYNETGKVLQTHKTNGINTSYIWGYNSQYPIAKIDNATYEDIENVFTDCKIGVAYTPCLDALKAGMYMETLGSFKILDDDDVRLLLEPLSTELPNAMISTYTYAPLIGMTSQTDPNGKTTYYEYDTFGRLMNVREHNHKILKNYVYAMQKTTSPGTPSPGSFSIFSAVPNGRTITINWTESEYANSYEVFLKHSSSTSYSKFGNYTETVFTFSGLSAGSYMVKIVANNNGEEISEATGSFEIVGPIITNSSIIGSTSYNEGDNVVFSLDITEGYSESLTYAWELRKSGSVIYALTTEGFNYALNDWGDFEIFCTVSNSETGETASASKEFSVSPNIVTPDILSGPTSLAANGTAYYIVSNYGSAESLEYEISTSNQSWLSNISWYDDVPNDPARLGISYNIPNQSSGYLNVRVRGVYGSQFSDWSDYYNVNLTSN